MGTVRFENDHFAAITGYGDYVQGNLIICHGEDLLTGSHDSNLYTISIFELAASSLVCLMSKDTSIKSWLWHRRLSHLNFGTINHLTKTNLVDRLPKLKYDKDHLCLAYESLCYPTNDRDDLGKMKLKADIGIFIGYFESSRGFRIYNRQTKKIMETIHVKFDELTTMASECNNSGPGFNCSNFQDSLEDSQSVPSKEDLDNLFGPLYEEYYVTIIPKVSVNSNELVQEDIAAFGGNDFYN
ncbi:retrovirus-related pol polyprotein from transposon TNT 1-94 [Tanacetum coccineum]